MQIGSLSLPIVLIRNGLNFKRDLYPCWGLGPQVPKSCQILRKDHGVRGTSPTVRKSKSEMAILDVAELRLWSSGNSAHSFVNLMGFSAQFCISGVTYKHTINIEDSVNEDHPSRRSF